MLSFQNYHAKRLQAWRHLNYQLCTHLTDFMDAYSVARRPKPLNGLMPYEYVCKIWTSESDRFILNPIHKMPGLNT